MNTERTPIISFSAKKLFSAFHLKSPAACLRWATLSQRTPIISFSAKELFSAFHLQSPAACLRLATLSQALQSCRACNWRRFRGRVNYFYKFRWLSIFANSFSVDQGSVSPRLKITIRQILTPRHYGDAIMGAISSQITSLTIVYSTVYSDADQRKHQSSASLAFVWPVNSPHKWPVTRKMFPFDDVIIQNAYLVVYGFKIFCEISKGTFEISHKIWNPYFTKYAFCWFLFLFAINDILELWRHKP